MEASIDCLSNLRSRTVHGVVEEPTYMFIGEMRTYTECSVMMSVGTFRESRESQTTWAQVKMARLGGL